MKVGTDGVLLGAWASTEGAPRRILDIGTGTGLIAVMMAQRVEHAMVTGIDIDDVTEACVNGAASPWSERVEFVQCAVQEFRPEEKFDLILSNPPFFVDSLTSPDSGRTQVRHAITLTFGELCDAVVRLLAHDGRFALVLPAVEAERFASMARGRLAMVRRCDVRTTPRRAPKRCLMEFMHLDAATAPCGSELLTIGTGEHECYTEEYRALTQDFYLKF